MCFSQMAENQSDSYRTVLRSWSSLAGFMDVQTIVIKGKCGKKPL
jgi:hypothetical protein